MYHKAPPAELSYIIEKALGERLGRVLFGFGGGKQDGKGSLAKRPVSTDPLRAREAKMSPM
jgi:hypothetical protein